MVILVYEIPQSHDVLMNSSASSSISATITPKGPNFQGMSLQ